MENNVRALNQTISDLTTQLSSNVAEMQVRIKEEAKLKSEIKRLELQSQRRV